VRRACRAEVLAVTLVDREHELARARGDGVRRVVDGLISGASQR
jgi:hypothetical protein